MLRVSYRNIDKVHFRAVKYDWASRLTRDRWRPEYITDADRNDLVNRQPDLEWSADLPPTPDYLERTKDIPAPKGLKPGFYFIVASPAANFGDAGNSISATDVWVSDLAIVMRTEWGKGKVEGFVLKAKSGDPVAGATIKTWVRQNTGGVTPGAGDKDRSEWAIFGARRPETLLHSRDQGRPGIGGDERVFELRLQSKSPADSDRAVHRSIALSPRSDDSLQGHLPLRQSAYGQLQGPAGPEGEGCFQRSERQGDRPSGSRVERFRLLQRQLHCSTRSTRRPDAHRCPRSGRRIRAFQCRGIQAAEVPGDGRSAESRTEAECRSNRDWQGNGLHRRPIGGAKVRYRVTREVRWPIWFYDYYWWRLPPNRGAAQEIAHGTAITEADGSFTVKFIAKPDPSISPKDEPTFHFTVHADVTDSTGETRSGSKSTVVGYTALQANLTADDWQTAGTP